MSNNPLDNKESDNENTGDNDNIADSENIAGNENIVDNENIEQPDAGNESVENTVEDKENSTGIEHLVKDYSEEEEEEDFSNDIVLDAQDDRGLIEQEDDILNWEVVGLYKDNGKMHPARYLKRNPPILTLKNDSGMEANFVLTKNLSYQLRYAVDSVYKGYFNIESNGINEDKTESKIKKWLPLIVIAVAIVGIYIFSVAF